MSAWKENGAKRMFQMAAGMAVVAVFMICGFLFANGLPAIHEIGWLNFLFGQVWRPGAEQFGIFPMIVGTSVVTLGALVVGGPVGVLCAVFLVYYCPKQLQALMKAIVNLMAGIPSVVYGFFGLVVLIPLLRHWTQTSGMSVLAAAILLGIMIVPTIISVSETALRAVPQTVYEGALALGATKDRAVFFTVLPSAGSGIFCAIVLGLGRAVGETMAVMMVAGNQAVLPNGLLGGVRTLTSNIAMEMGYAADLHRQALIGTAVVLFGMILAMNALMAWVKRRIAS